MSENSTVRKGKADLVFQMPVSVNAQFGNSDANILYFALIGSQDRYLKQLVEDLNGQDWDSAYVSFQDLTSIQQLMGDLILGLSKLANENFLVSDAEGNADRFESSRKNNQETHRSYFASFLKGYTHLNPEEVDNCLRNFNA